MDMYELTAPGDLIAPALVVAFEGWVNAGGVGTAAAQHIAEEGEEIVTFDSEALFDYRVNRPVVDFVDGKLTEVAWPEVTMWRRRFDGRDVLILTGPEPNWQWKAFARSVAAISLELGVVEHISLGGVPAATPHTRPARILTTASRPDLIADDEHPPEGLLRVPGAAVNVVERATVDAGIPAIGFWTQVPHYVGGTYYSGVVALVERVARHVGASIPLGGLVDEAAAQRMQLDDTVAARPEASDYVRRLEEIVDAEEAVPSGEDIAAEVERFLREAIEDDGDVFGRD